MKINGQFVIRRIMGDTILIPVGESALQMKGMITLNETAAFLWTGLEHHLSRQDLLAGLLEEFEVEPGEAEKDMDAFFDKLTEAGILER